MSTVTGSIGFWFFIVVNGIWTGAWKCDLLRRPGWLWAATADPVVSVCWPLYRFNLKEAERTIAAFRDAVPDSAPLKKHNPPLDVFISFYPQLKDL